jgi:hypothetical protein
VARATVSSGWLVSVACLGTSWGVAFRDGCRDNEDNRGEAVCVLTCSSGPPARSSQQAPVGGSMENANRVGQDGDLSEKQEEAKKIRRLQVMISMVTSVLGQDPNLTVEEASELVAGAKRAALAMFPDKELAFDILYKPRLQRLMKERFRIQ